MTQCSECTGSKYPAEIELRCRVQCLEVSACKALADEPMTSDTPTSPVSIILLWTRLYLHRIVDHKMHSIWTLNPNLNTNLNLFGCEITSNVHRLCLVMSSSHCRLTEGNIWWRPVSTNTHLRIFVDDVIFSQLSQLMQEWQNRSMLIGDDCWNSMLGLYASRI